MQIHAEQRSHSSLSAQKAGDTKAAGSGLLASRSKDTSSAARRGTYADNSDSWTGDETVFSTNTPGD